MKPLMTLALSVCVFASLGTPAMAADQAPPPPQADAPALPSWDALTPAQREVLLAPVRARWNDNPQQRAEMLRRAQHWVDMSPHQRKAAMRGMHRWEHLSPEQQAEARELYKRMKTMTPEARRALRMQWKDMSRSERAAWLRTHPAP